MATPLTPRQRLTALRGYPVVAEEDFAGTDLVSLHASGHLRFHHCSFAGADLRHAALDGCSFLFCDLSGANLRGASLRGVSLSGCDLRGADLRDTDLTGARLATVNTGRPPHGLTDATGARFEGAVLRDIQVDSVIGWERGAEDGESALHRKIRP
jgi:uncharacterized protein YjbI with pentapeptide repeats